MTSENVSATGFEKGRRWNARWIWAPGDPKAPNSYYYFRKEFTLDGPPAATRLHITADTRYQLFINGRLVGRGAPQSQPFFQYYDTHDVDEYLREGLNCVAVIGNYVGNLPDTRGGVLAELVNGDGQTLLATGPAWRVTRAAAWSPDGHYYRGNKTTPYQEFYDARRAPQGWSDVGFDDSQWTRAAAIGARGKDRPPAVIPWINLVPRDIPFMTADPVLPVRVEKVEESLDLINRSRPNDLAPGLSMVGGPVKYTRVEDPDNLCRAEGDTVVRCSVNHLESLDFDGLYAPAIVLDFGKVLMARCEIRLNGVDGGMVDIGYAERLIDGHFNIAMECEFADRYTMADGEQTYEPFTWKAFRFLKLRFHSCFKPVTIQSVRAIVSTYPYEERGLFDSGDETLNKVWGISRETIRLCSNEFLMDTPWREQAQWLGDVAAVTVPAIYACFGDTRLPGKFYRQAAMNQFPTGMISNISNTVNLAWQTALTDYSLWWAVGLWNHYLYTGEARWLDCFYPQALRVIYAHMEYVNEFGLLENGGRPFIDWAPVDKRGESAAYNGVFYGALEAIEKIARFKNDAYTIDLAERAMTDLRANFQTRLFDPARGCVADCRVDDDLSDKASEQANAAAVLWGLCDKDGARQIVENVFEKKSVKTTEAQPFFSVVVLNALDKMGRFDLALQYVRDRWGKRMVERGATSVYEEWYCNGSYRGGEFSGFLRTHSHAWSGCPAEFLIRNLMGLEILEPGCRRVRLAPKQTPFDYTAQYPTPLGVIEVLRQDGVIKTSAPEEMEVTQ